MHCRDSAPEPKLHAVVRQLGMRVRVRSFGERREHVRAAIDKTDLPARRRPIRRDQGCHELGQRTGGLDSGRAAADHHDMGARRFPWGARQWTSRQLGTHLGSSLIGTQRHAGSAVIIRRRPRLRILHGRRIALADSGGG